MGHQLADTLRKPLGQQKRPLLMVTGTKDTAADRRRAGTSRADNQYTGHGRIRSGSPCYTEDRRWAGDPQFGQDVDPQGRIQRLSATPALPPISGACSPSYERTQTTYTPGGSSIGPA